MAPEVPRNNTKQMATSQNILIKSRDQLSISKNIFAKF